MSGRRREEVYSWRVTRMKSEKLGPRGKGRSNEERVV